MFGIRKYTKHKKEKVTKYENEKFELCRTYGITVEEAEAVQVSYYKYRSAVIAPISLVEFAAVINNFDESI